LVKKDGILNKTKSIKRIKSYLNNIDFNSNKLNKFKYFDAVISDYCLSALNFASKFKILSIGVCHFTWSWFFSNLKLEKKYVNKIKYYEQMCNLQVFPPLTPKDCIKKFKKKKIINFITSHKNKKKIKSEEKILILDSGGRVLKNKINNIVQYINRSKYQFFLDKYSLSKKNLNIVKKSKNLKIADGKKSMNHFFIKSRLIICRGGFNTITEALYNQKPLLLTEEKNNPEIRYNIKKINLMKLGNKINLNDWNYNFLNKIDSYFKNNYLNYKKRLKKNKFKFNGAEQFLNILKNELYKYKKN
jgi:UDP-N-acetylglucosamine:LPS N-acetylglucosamine transferase